MRHTHPPLLALLLLLFAASALAADTIRTFPLHHRTASELIPVIRPMLDATASVTGLGYTLVVRGSEKDLADTEQMLKELDKTPERLMITVRRGHNGAAESSGASISGRIGSGEPRARVRVFETERGDHSEGEQRLQVTEGQWARLRYGLAVPFGQQTITHSSGGTTIQQGIEYKNVDSGVEVRPRLSGDQVTLEIRPYHGRLSPSGGGVIESDEISTTVSGALGSWIDLGGYSEHLDGHGSGTVYSTSDLNDDSHRLQVKVERMR